MERDAPGRRERKRPAQKRQENRRLPVQSPPVRRSPNEGGPFTGHNVPECFWKRELFMNGPVTIDNGSVTIDI
jgi:hypothetical protein